VFYWPCCKINDKIKVKLTLQEIQKLAPLVQEFTL
jgi:hypothetical protein